MLKIHNLHKYFWGIQAVNGCSFSLPENKITALIWPNGSGKSTIMNCISWLIKPNTWNIYFDDENITKKSVEHVSNIGISRLFQSCQLCPNLSVLDNLLLWFDNDDTSFFRSILCKNHETEKEEIIKRYLKEICMENKLQSRVDALSYGQQRLVEFTRLLLKPCKLMLLDEPTAGVHTLLKKSMTTKLKELKKKKQTIFFIEHDLQFVFNLADYIIVIDEGKIIAQWSPQDIKNNPKVIDAYLWK